MPTFDQLYNEIPAGAKSVVWKVPTVLVDDAISFFREKVPDVRYTVSESWCDDDVTNITFILKN